MRHYYSKKDFKNFKKHCKHWLNKFGITEYDIDYSHREIDGNVARVSYDTAARHANFSLALYTDADFCLQKDMSRLALHEVIHLLIAEFEEVVKNVPGSDISIMAEHAVIMRIINAIMGQRDEH